ncbi:MAG: LemA family protein [Bacteroidales bacterium]|nr:LemA family protein [Bacteroidales bacterium]MBQ7532521.1 LemA family protein [Bacteroidales bacterium]
MKKKSLVTILIIVAVVLVIYLWFKSGYNAMVEKQETVSAQWAQVENVYQRRADLIPNLVATVKGYAQHEQGTLTAVIEARAKATSVTIDPTNLDPDDIAQFQAAQDQLSGALSRLLVSVEAYPELKANENFMALQAQLEGTENRITVERQKFNEKAMEYNQYIRKFPRNIIAGMFDFEKVGYFKAQAGAETAPKVEF